MDRIVVRRRPRVVRMTSSDFYFLGMMAMCALLTLLNWSKYETCQDPLNVWLFVHFLGLFGLKVLCFSTDYYHFRPRTWAVCGREVLAERAAAGFLAKAYLPFEALWVVVGTWWYVRSRHCFPRDGNETGVVLWLVIGAIYQLVYLKPIVRAYRRAQVPLDARAPEDDLEPVWMVFPRVAGAGGRGPLPREGTGLLPEELEQVAVKTLSPESLPAENQRCCSICFEDLQPGDEVPEVPCGHSFHKACLFRWLAQRNDCPDCRAVVLASDVDVELARPRSGSVGSAGSVGSEDSAASVASVGSVASFASDDDPDLRRVLELSLAEAEAAAAAGAAAGAGAGAAAGVAAGADAAADEV